jgi:hypothetical protein
LEKAINMKYPKDKFFQNLQMAMKLDDHDMIIDLLNDQITDIALTHPDALHAALKNAGISVTSSVDPKYLVGLVADNWNNKKLIQNISLMISDVNTTKPADHHYGGGGGAQVSMPSGNMVGDIVKGVGDIVQGAGRITEAAMAPKIEKEKNKGKMFDMLTAKASVKGTIANADALVEVEKQKQKASLVYAGVALAIVIVGAIAFVVVKQASGSSTPAA